MSIKLTDTFSRHYNGFGNFILFSLIQFFFTAFLSAIIFYVLNKPAVDKLIKRRGWKKGNIALLVIFVSVFVILMPISLFITLLYSKNKRSSCEPAFDY